MDAGGVPVVHHRHVLRELADHPDLFDGQGRAAGSDDVPDAELVHRDDVHVAFQQVAAAGLGDLGLRQPDAVEVAALDVNLRLRGIDVLRDGVVGAEGPPAEGDHAAAQGVDREHHPLVEAVGQAAVVVTDAEAAVHEVFLLVAGGEGGLRQRMAVRGRPAEAELGEGPVLEPAPAVVRPREGAALGRVEVLHEEFLGELGDQQEALAALARGDFLGGLLFLDDFDVVFPGQVAQGLDVGHVLVLHHETDRRARLAAAEALEDAFRRRNIEGRGLFVVERAAGDEVRPAALQADEVGDDVFNARGIQDKVDSLLGDHDAISQRNLIRTRRTSISS